MTFITILLKTATRSDNEIWLHKLASMLESGERYSTDDISQLQIMLHNDMSVTVAIAR
jgi:hypothetical protein